MEPWLNSSMMWRAPLHPVEHETTHWRRHWNSQSCFWLLLQDKTVWCVSGWFSGIDSNSGTQARYPHHYPFMSFPSQLPSSVLANSIGPLWKNIHDTLNRCGLLHSKMQTNFFHGTWGPCPLNSGSLDFVSAVAVRLAWLCISGNEASQNGEMEAQTVVWCESNVCLLPFLVWVSHDWQFAHCLSCSVH